MRRIVAQPSLLGDWVTALTQVGGIGQVGVTAVIAFPLLVLGLSGFETGVAMMPLIRADGKTSAQRTAAKLRNTRKLLTTAAVIMSVYLLATTFVTTLLIPPAAFEVGGNANGRALAYLAHENLGNGFGTVYDLSSVLILWFAGASAMAGLVNIVPRYLPGYGMAPDWARAVRPVVLVYVGLAAVITWVFSASVDAQAGAYATGVLAMMLSGAVAVTLSAYRASSGRAVVGFGTVALVLGYALVDNVVAEPSGIAISGVFIAVVLVVSLISRTARSTELRVGEVTFDETAREFIADSLRHDGSLNIITSKPHTVVAGETVTDELVVKESVTRTMNPVAAGADVLFLQVKVTDPSSFVSTLDVHGEQRGTHKVLTVRAPSIPNAVAAVLLALGDVADVAPHAHFDWSNGSPVWHAIRFLTLGEGDTAPLVREILRSHEGTVKHRPVLHVGG